VDQVLVTLLDSHMGLWVGEGFHGRHQGDT
jgi:hypothetical protein